MRSSADARSLNALPSVRLQTYAGLTCRWSKKFDFRSKCHTGVAQDAFAASVTETETLAQPEDFDFLSLIGEGFSQMRRYTRIFLEALKVKAAPPARDLLAGFFVIVVSFKQRVLKFAILFYFEIKGSLKMSIYSVLALLLIASSSHAEDDRPGLAKALIFVCAGDVLDALVAVMCLRLDFLPPISNEISRNPASPKSLMDAANNVASASWALIP